MYVLGNLTSIPALWILYRDKLLHHNFRAILFIIIASGYVMSVTNYIQIARLMDGTFENAPSCLGSLEMFFNFGSTLFVYGNLCLTIERWLALVIVATYEKYSSYVSAVTFTGLIVVIPPMIFLTAGCDLWYESFLTSFLTFFVLSLASGMVSTYLRFCKTTRIRDINSSLGSRFQSEENCKTMVIYLTLSLSELLTSLVMVLLMYLMYLRGEGFMIEDAGPMADAADMVGSMRIVVVHGVLIYYYYKRERSRASKSLFMTQNAEDHFKAMNEIWK
ncbi:hypothetical protein Q1695_009846 [Nippostrongylus brasiliensis]|nr:hypothetical protein Q1695_009846 [Nippostrongylus brasiliensis]